MGRQNSMRKPETPARPADSLDLELPDWSGMDHSSARISPEAAFRLCEHYPSILQAIRVERPRDDAGSWTVEFVL